MATEKQIAANRLNGLKGGVKTPEGKAISRLNARKHGIFASALTEGDGEELRAVLDELTAELNPLGVVEQLLVDKLAVTYLRMQRCAKAENVYLLEQWNSSSGRRGQFRYNETLVNIGLYDARLTHQFLRLLHEIEWRRKARTQEGARHLPQPPASVTSLNQPQFREPPPAQAKPALSERSRSTLLTAMSLSNGESNGPLPQPCPRRLPSESGTGGCRPVPQVKNEPISPIRPQQLQDLPQTAKFLCPAAPKPVSSPRVSNVSSR